MVTAATPGCLDGAPGGGGPRPARDHVRRPGAARRPATNLPTVDPETVSPPAEPDLDAIAADLAAVETTLDEQQLSEEPLAGSLLAITPGVKGLAETPFAG